MPKNDSIKDISQFLRELKKLKKNNDNEFFFRGEVKKFPKRVPSIYRDDSWLKNEDKLFREFVLRNPNEFINEKSTFEILAKMQHYSLPTRLLDITSNPLIALFHACNDEISINQQGYVYVFNIPNEYIRFYDSDRVSVVSNISRLPIKRTNFFNISKNRSESNNEFIKRFNKNKHIKYLDHEIKGEKPYFQPIIDQKHINKIWCVKPQLKNPRIIKQDGAFLLFGIKGKNKECLELADIFKTITLKIKRGKTKHEMLNDLEILGISKDKLFPEMDIIAKFLQTKFKSK